MITKYFLVEKEDEDNMSCTAIPLFKTSTDLEMMQIGSEFIYKDNRYKIKRIESILDSTVLNRILQSHINIYVEEI